MKVFVSVQNLRWSNLEWPIRCVFSSQKPITFTRSADMSVIAYKAQHCKYTKFSLWSDWWYECFSEETVCLPARTVWSAVSQEITVQKFFSTFCPLTSLAPHDCTMMPSMPQTYSKKEVCASSGTLFSLNLISSAGLHAPSVFHLHYFGFQHQLYSASPVSESLIHLLCLSLVKVSV